MDGAKQLYMETTAAVEQEVGRGLSDEDWHARSVPYTPDASRDCNGQAPPASVVGDLKRYHEGDPGDETEGPPTFVEHYLAAKAVPPLTSDEIVQALAQHMKDAPERQLERRRAWARFAAAFGNRYPNTQAAEEADKLLAEYDRRFGA